MTRDETKKIIAVMVSIYPSFKPMDLSQTVSAWAMMFEDYSYSSIASALKEYTLASGSAFAPSISELISIACKDKTDSMNEAEAWNMVRKAIGKANYYAEEEFEKFPAEVQKAVGSPSQLRIWASDSEFNEGVESSNFKKVYRQVIERRQYEIKLGSSQTIGAREQERIEEHE